MIFGKYQVLRKIASGGMGDVLLAQHGHRLVILKSVADLSRLHDEAQLASKLHHPNVVSTIEAGQWGARFYLVMEYIPGWNLSQLMRRLQQLGLSLSPLMVAQIIASAARGLEHAHEALIVHRDVSPQNIIVRPDAVTKVVDFGVAWALGFGSQAQPGGVAGRVGYAAPEHLTGEAVDARCDQFALGVVFWELLTARRLYGGKGSAAEVARAVLASQVPHPSQLNPEVPRELAEVALRMLDPAPGKRFARCEDVATTLDRLGADQPPEQLRQLLAQLGPVAADTLQSPRSAAEVAAKVLDRAREAWSQVRARARAR